MKKRILHLGAAGLLLPLAACMNMSGLGGDSRYACKAPEGVACDSVSGTYANAIHDNLPSQRTRRSPAPSIAETTEERAASALAHLSPSIPRSGMPPADESAPGLAPSPLRSQARVLRLWIKPWEDTDGDLVDQGYVYVQVDSGQWLIDHVQRQIRDAYAPLKSPPKPATNAATELDNGLSTPAAPIQLNRSHAPDNSTPTLRHP